MIAIAFIVGLFVGVGICWRFVIRARRLVASYAAAINVLSAVNVLTAVNVELSQVVRTLSVEVNRLQCGKNTPTEEVDNDAR